MRITLLIGVGLLIPAFALVAAPQGGETIASMQSISEWLAGYPLLAPVLFIIIYTCVVVLFLPSTLFCLLGGALFGTLLGTILALTSATLGACIAFVIARYLAADMVERRSGKTLQQLKHGVEREGWRFVAFIRLIPMVPYNISNYAFGLTRIPISQFAAATAICLIPRIAVYAYIGHSGMSLFSKEGDHLVTLVSMATLLIAVLLLPWLYGRIRQPLNHQG